MQKSKITFELNLQLFADAAAGDSGTGSEAGTQGVSGVPNATNKGVKSNPLADVVYGKQDDVQTTDAQNDADNVADRQRAYDDFIKNNKDLDDARIQNIVQKRLKNSKDTEERYKSTLPLLDILANKYNVNSDDIAGLTKAIEDDDSFFEEEALERCLTVDQLKEIRRMERENSALKQQMREQETQERANALYQNWLSQADATKNVYPSFDLDAEMQNPQFVNLLRNNVDVRTAYEVLHKDDIIRGAMQFTAQTVEQKISNKIAANGRRPSENGTNDQGSVMYKSDVSQLSKADRQEIIRRVARGEKIRF